MRYGKRLTAALLMLLLLLPATGCGQRESNTKVVLTSGFEKGEVFRLENKSCSEAEMMVYLTNIQNQYENVYGSRIWDAKVDGVTLESNVKDMALSKMAQIKAINLLAEREGIALDDEELKKVGLAADEYYGSLNEREIEAMGIDREVIFNLYKEYALSEKLYQDTIKDINPEISDDEARTITVEHILIKTYNLDEDGNRHEYTEYAKKEARDKAESLLERIKAGEDFENLASEFNEDSSMTYSFGKGEMDPVFENAAFNLGEGEVSDIVETEYGYHIIKCISTFNREVTDANKLRIVDERRNKAFSEVYDGFVGTLNKNINTELWESISFVHDDNIRTCDFFEVIDRIWND
jgi:foldase protein PrsA